MPDVFPALKDMAGGKRSCDVWDHCYEQTASQALEALEEVVPGMDAREDAAVVLDQALLPLMQLAEKGSAEALSMLATMLEQRPRIAVRSAGCVVM